MTVSRPSAVILSPHLDDAVFSCPGWIRQRAEDGELPLVVTLFSHADVSTNGETQRAYERRQREDEEAVKLIGAARRLAGFADARFRSRTYGSFSGVVCRRVDDDVHVVAKVESYVQALMEELKPRRVLAPLGVGQHVDHQIVHEVAYALASRHPDTEFAFYEDRPYAFVEESVRLRLSQLQRRSHAADFRSISPALRSERFFHSFFSAPYARQQLRATDQTRIVACMLEVFVRALQEPSRPARSSISTWAPDIMQHLLPALDAYASPARGFLGSPLYHQWAALEYARRMGHGGQYAERYWYL